jgi:DNA-binding beta-propeller fold protein YncE
MKAPALLFTLALSLAASLSAVPRNLELPGRLPAGYLRLHSGAVINPAGTLVPLGDFPSAMAVSPSGRFVAVLHTGAVPDSHEVRLLNAKTGALISDCKLEEAFQGIAWSPDGLTLYAGLASKGTVQVLSCSADGKLAAVRELPLLKSSDKGVCSGIAVSEDGARLYAAVMLDNSLVCVEISSGRLLWRAAMPKITGSGRVNDVARNASWPSGLAEPFCVVPHRDRLYVSLWGGSEVAVFSAVDGKAQGTIPCGLHPNALLVSPAGQLFVSNGGLNTVSVIDLAQGRVVETLSSASSPEDLPGSTPDALALSPDGRRLYVANAYNNNVAVFDISSTDNKRCVGFIPTGWFPSCLAATPDGRGLLVVSARGAEARANGQGSTESFVPTKHLYPGALEIIRFPRWGADDALARWTATAAFCRQGGLVPREQKPFPYVAQGGEPTAIRNVIYIIKENRTYDQVLGDMPEGNGDPSLCLFPEKVTPNQHALAREFVLLDNFYANAEVSSSGHEWSTAAYSSEFVERIWPVSYGHHATLLPYPAEGGYDAAVPASGYLWDRAAEAKVSYRSYGEFALFTRQPKPPFTSRLKTLQGHVDPEYMPWNLAYPDTQRAARFISELHRFEKEGGMPRLQILRLPQDHTAGVRPGDPTPNAMVADNDLALGQIVDAVSHSKYWKDTVIFVVEDDSQNGPDHVEAHRTTAFVIGAFVKRGFVDSTAYTTCSLLRSIELILGMQPLSQFDARAQPMSASFTLQPDYRPYDARAAQVDLNERNPKSDSKPARLSMTLDLSKEDSADEATLNYILWTTSHLGNIPMPAPRHAAYLQAVAAPEDDDD